MTEKGAKKKAIKNYKKTTKDKKPITLKFNNGVEIPAKSIYKEDSMVFNINDIEIDKIKVSDKKLYNKKHNSYQHYVFYEDDDEYIHLKTSLLDVPGYYNIFSDDSKTMNFKFDDDSLGKIIDIFEHIGEILNIDLYHYLYDGNNGMTYFRTKVSAERVFRKDKDKTTNTIPNEKTKYNCRVLLQIKSVYGNNNKGIIEDEDYYPQVFLQNGRYTFFANNKLIHEALYFTDTESKSESEQEEFNENSV